MRAMLFFFVAVGAWAAATGTVVIVHDEEAPMQSLAQALSHPHGIRSVLMHQDEWKHGIISGSRAVVMYVHRPNRPELEQDLIQYVNAGGRIVVVHHGIASAKVKNPEWLRLTGIQILPKDHPTHPWKVLRGNYQLVNLLPSHYVTSHGIRYPAEISYTPSDEPSLEQRLPALEFPDTEIFLNQLFTDGRDKTVLYGFKTEVSGKTYMQDRAGWLKRAGRGYVFYFQPGHRAEDYTPAYVQILVNAITWKPR